MPHSLEQLAKALKQHAVEIATRRRQKLSLAGEPDEVIYLIRGGLHIARAPLPHERYQILELLYPGDLVRAKSLPPLDGTEITAASERGAVWRLRWSSVRTAMDNDPGIARVVSDRLANQNARSSLHNAVIAGLTGDERVAALMLELALRLGKATANGAAFEMPLSRLDIAEYLALNPDTVSRIVSRMRTSDLISATGRNYLVCRSLDALAAACPLTPAITRMHKVQALASVSA